MANGDDPRFMRFVPRTRSVPSTPNRGPDPGTVVLDPDDEQLDPRFGRFAPPPGTPSVEDAPGAPTPPARVPSTALPGQAAPAERESAPASEPRARLPRVGGSMLATLGRPTHRGVEDARPPAAPVTPTRGPDPGLVDPGLQARAAREAILGIPRAPADGRPRSAFGEVLTGARVGLESSAVGAGESLEQLGELTGSEGIRARGELLSQDAAARQEAASAGSITRIGDVHSLQDFTHYAAFAVGQGLGSSAAPLVGGAVGAAAGSVIPGVGTGVGATVGAFGPSYGMLLGEIRQALEAEAVDPRLVEIIAPIVAVPAAGLDVLLPRRVVTGLATGAPLRFGIDLAKRIVRRALEGGFVEGITEGLQGLLTKGAVAGSSPHVEFLTIQTLQDLVNDALAGALPGSVLGGAGGAVEGIRAPRVEPPPPGAAERRSPGPLPTDDPGARPESRPEGPDGSEGISEPLPVPGEEATGAPQSRPIPLEGLRRRAADVIHPERRDELERAFTDPLTGLSNAQAWGTARPRIDASPELEVVTADVRGLKPVNDVLGHEAGDALLNEAGNVLLAAARQLGVGPRDVFRIGGDEFAIAVPAGQGEAAAAAIQAALPSRPIEGTPFQTGIRTGVGSTFSEADRAMTQALQGEEGPRARETRVGRPAPTASDFRTAGPGDVVLMPPGEIAVDAERFQFRREVNQSGVTRSMEEVEVWNPEYADVALVWRDPGNGRAYVVDGHHRRELAVRLGAPELLVRFINAPSPQAAMVVGAAANIAKGNGTAVDAARVMRAGLTEEVLRSQGVPLSGALVRDGLAIANLHEGLFHLAATGRLAPRRAALIGGSGLAAEEQMALYRLIEKREASGKDLTNAQVEELIRFTRAAPSGQETQETLFGEESLTKSLAIEKAMVSAHIRDRLSRDRRLFGYIARGQRAARLGEEGVGTVDVEKAGQIATEAAQLLELYDRLAHTQGPVADALNDAAKELSKGQTPARVYERAFGRVREAIAEAIPGGGLERGEGSPGDAGERSAPDGSVRGPDDAPGLFDPPLEGADPQPLADAPANVDPVFRSGPTSPSIEVLQDAYETSPPAAAALQGDQTQAERAPNAAPHEELSATVGDRTFFPVSTVELIRLVRQILSDINISTMNFPTARGAFLPDPKAPRLWVNRALGRDYGQFAHTLAHEIGHAIDFLPDRVMQKGNILGRLAALRGYLASTVDSTPTDPTRAIGAADRKAFRKAAEKEAGERPKAGKELSEWRARVNARYAEILQAEIEARGLLTREQIHEELMALSEWWRPFDRETASQSHINYRESAAEVYADAMSVLLVSPGSIQERAPVFFDAWLAYLERRPEVMDAYMGIQDLLASGEETVYGARKSEIEADFARGEEIRRAHEERQDPQSLRSYLKQLLVSRGAPVTDAESRRLGKSATPWSDERTVKMALQELNHADNVNRLMLMDIESEVHRPLAAAGITEETLGQYLMMVRIADGDRGGMAEQAKDLIIEITGEESWPAAREAFAQLPEGDPNYDPELLQVAETGVLNPRGYTPEAAQRNLDGIEREVGPEKFQLLEDRIQQLRRILFRTTVEAVRVGNYNRRTFQEKILPNRHTYAPFAVLDYYNGRVPAGVKAQVGTLKSVANPYTSAILKAMALNRWNEYQKAKLAVLRHVDEDFPGVAGPVRAVDKFHPMKQAGPGRENLSFMVDGKLHYREVDEYIAKVFERSDLGAAERVIKTLSSATYRFFHPLYVAWSIGWQARNVPRDWKRTYKNLAVAHQGRPTYRQAIEAVLDLGRVARSYFGVTRSAWAQARMRHDPLIREMLEDKALGRAFHSFEPAGEASTYERLLQRYGLVEPHENGIRRVARGVGRPVETIGVWQETWAKAAAFRYLGERGITGRERAYIVRNYTGTPDSTERGLASDATNGLYLYANVIMAGLRADAEVGLQPKTAAGYWMRSVMIDFAPKAVMWAASAGLLGYVMGEAGDELEEWFRRVPSYDLEKYIIVPIPPFYSENERGEKKAVYLRVPHDDANRILAAATWALFSGRQPVPADAGFVERTGRAVSKASALVAGEFPGLNPGLDLVLKWGQAALQDRNPYDSFRGRNVVPQTEWDARGWPRWREMLRYSSSEFGIVSQILGAWTFSSPDEGAAAPGERVLRSIPGLSSLVTITDRGLNENRYWELDWEDQLRARLRADMAPVVRRALSDRNRLNRFGIERLSQAENERRLVLNAWYTSNYRRLAEDLEFYRDEDNRERYSQALADLNASVPQ